MTQERIIMAIGRIERALARIENLPLSKNAGQASSGLSERHEALKSEARRAISDIDDLLAGLG